MRVIAGKFKGKTLCEFSLGTTRPTADMLREALFDKIGFNIENSVFLDLFAGTGAVGIEALSRSAKECYFADKEKKAIEIINKNLKLINAQNYDVLNMDYQSALEIYKKNGVVFDFVFLDPPYATSCAEDAIDIIIKSMLISDNSTIIWEHDSSKIDYIKCNFKNHITKKYGKKYLTYIYYKYSQI